MTYESPSFNNYSGIDDAGYRNNFNDHEEIQTSGLDALSSPTGEFYSVGMNPYPGLKEKIEYVHGSGSPQVSFIDELESYLGDRNNYCQASQKFKTFIQYHGKRPQNIDYLVDEFINSGYLTALERISAPGSEKELEFYKNYAIEHGMTLPQAVLFGPNGAIKQAYGQWRIEEALRGQHRGNSKPANAQMAQAYDHASINTNGIPETKDKCGNYQSIDIDADTGKLPEGLESQIIKAYGREPQLYLGNGYKGTKRLSGDLPYKLLEAMTIELLTKQNLYNSGSPSTSKSKLESIVEEANKNCQDAFVALYEFYGKDRLKNVWNDARKVLNDYAEILWQQRDLYTEQIVKRKKKQLLGTIYLNNGRYYWLPKKGEKVVPLIPEKQNDRLSGGLYKNEPGGYFWWIPTLKFRRRMVEPGCKVATKDFYTARKLQKQEWGNIQKYEPKLAMQLKAIRKWAAATKHKPTAVKIAKNIWEHIQENNPEMAARIMYDKTAERTKPDVDAVWPIWKEEMARLDKMDNKPQIPIVYPKQDIHDEWKYGLRVPKTIESMVGKIKKVDWLVKDAMLVFDGYIPSASKEIAIQSNGKEWTNEQKGKNKNYVIQGSTSIDRDTGRIRIDIYNPGFGKEWVLAEEVYHIVFEIIREASPIAFEAIRHWYDSGNTAGADETQPIGERFAFTMAQEETGRKTSLPRSVVKHAQNIFSDKCKVDPSIMEKVKNNWPAHN